MEQAEVNRNSPVTRNKSSLQSLRVGRSSFNSSLWTKRKAFNRLILFLHTGFWRIYELGTIPSGGPSLQLFDGSVSKVENQVEKEDN